MAHAITELALGLVLALAVAPAASAADEHKYVSAKKCRTCHKDELIGNQFGEWKKSAHAGALETLNGDKAAEYAKEAGISGSPAEAEECVKCHVTAYGVDAALLPKKGLKHSDGVQCESCHGPGADYRKKKVMSDRDKALAKGMWEPGKNAEICTACHNDDSPAWDAESYTLADGSKTGFDFEQAKKKIAHAIPEDVKGHYIELKKKLKEEKRARGEAADEE